MCPNVWANSTMESDKRLLTFCNVFGTGTQTQQRRRGWWVWANVSQLNVKSRQHQMALVLLFMDMIKSGLSRIRIQTCRHPFNRTISTTPTYPIHTYIIPTITDQFIVSVCVCLRVSLNNFTFNFKSILIWLTWYTMHVQLKMVHNIINAFVQQICDW